MPDEFYKGTDWQQSSDPTLTFKVQKIAPDDTTYLIWPVDAPKDVLADGLHPIVALGDKATNRPRNLTGVVTGYDANCAIAVVDLAEKKIVRNYVTNILTYDAQGDPATFKNTILGMDPVYVDDSTDLPAGSTLSFSPMNEDDAANPLAGYVFWCQDEYADSCVGGPNSVQGISQPAATDTLETLTLCIMLTNDYGTADLIVHIGR